AIRIISAILEDAAQGHLGGQLAALERKSVTLTVGQRRLDRFEQLATHEDSRRRLGRCRRARTGGEPLATPLGIACRHLSPKRARRHRSNALLFWIVEEALD